MGESATRYAGGDEVATPDGRGVVAAVLTDDDERTRDHCPAMNDEVLRTQRWRDRF